MDQSSGLSRECYFFEQSVKVLTRKFTEIRALLPKCSSKRIHTIESYSSEHKIDFFIFEYDAPVS